ncbi:heterokaryon incompatibility protein-domain-containing protein [Triangularia setosa]|uniref:Heterokaryon incompatibility protein-domain-containing protein n=1 Tax=Triangularia setosa TaxID=2587417 RepID=A0AAN7A0J0_9PEZI|nr:heterokaryon incompatibility protein-domain-containing protein [Podospora setosa]
MPFEYSPLSTERREIRLLDLEPSFDQNGPLELRIHSTTLDEVSEYTCLSYVWGEPGPTKAIRLNEQQFLVRQNLFTALLYLRLPDKTRRLWIDAVCINQNDIRERENQVSIMQHIYQKATDVIAWTGEADHPRDKKGVAFLEEIKLQTGYTQLGFPVGMMSDKADLTPGTLGWLKSVTPFGFVNSPWLDLLAILERPWFSRIWIVQEVVMGKTVTVWCGHHRIEWFDFLYCALFVLGHVDILTGIAAPDCLRYHDLHAHLYFQSDLPLYRLIEAAKKIRCVGQLALRQLLDRHMELVIGDDLQLWEENFKKHNAGFEVEIWGEMTLDPPDLRLCYSSAGIKPNQIKSGP